MDGFRCVFLLVGACCVFQAEGRKTFSDMFPHKHEATKKFPFPIPPLPPIPGWSNDSTPWDDYLYPPMKPQPNLKHHKGKPTVHLTSDSPALNGSVITFTAKLQYPPCQKEDANGDLLWDEHCEDGNGLVRSGYVYNWTSWLDDYGFAKCMDVKKCNVFPDGKPFPQSNDWRRKSYVYVWHTMGQYYETSDGSSSSVNINTTTIPVGAEVLEVLVYRKHENRKYIPLSTDNTVFFVTDKIPVAVSISQSAAVNQSKNVFFRGEDILFEVQLHDPSGYLKSAASIDYIWDFKDGNQLVTRRAVTTHNYNRLGNMTLEMVVEAAFPMECPPTSATPTQESTTPPPPSEVPTTLAIKTETPQATTTSQPLTSSTPIASTSGEPTTEPLPSAATETPEPGTVTTPLFRSRRLTSGGCFRYVRGSFVANITIIEPKHPLRNPANSRIVEVSASRITKTDISFLVKCLGSIPTTACTIISDHTCTQVRGIMCDDIPPSPKCEVHFKRAFSEPGTYCVNITLGDSGGLALTSTTVTINKSQDPTVSKSYGATEVVLSSLAVLVAAFAFIAYMVCKRYKVYRPIHRSLVESPCSPAGVRGRMIRLKEALFPSSEESHRLLSDRRPV